MFEQKIMKKICELVSDYCDKHPNAPRCGAECVWQNDSTRDDAIELVADIMDVFARDYKEMGESY